MRYRSILIYVSNAIDLEGRIRLAARLASGQSVTVIGLAISGLSRFMSQVLPAVTGSAGEVLPDAAPLPAEEQERREKKHLDMTISLERFKVLAQEFGIARIQTLRVDDDAAAALSNHGNAADLIVLGKSELHGIEDRKDSDFIEFVALNAAAPVLAISEKPFSWRHALIAWNGSSAAARAVRNAIPLLQDVGAISAVIFGDGIVPGTNASASEDELKQCLSSLDKPIDILHRPAATDVGHALLALAAELDADLIVMGCVAHPRWRGVLLGGTTGVVIAESPVALLLSR
ncbi:universal stress protein [Herbaspirillum lusitanum]|uniref:universal stress protein n=1 Tax=Herbaspirillum lusitanum TaxID=213312 RepID=UPI00223910D9|nr:universal stress protein [Herbaspirillum lusitanum]MCW5299196.1 universal stress protein [Herbaspirillum lusitanum]